MELQSGQNLPYLRESMQKLSDVYKNKGRILEAYGGNLKAIGLLKVEPIAVADVHINKGHIFPQHKHGAKEWIICYEGSFLFEYGDKSIKLNAGDSWRIDTNVLHGISVTYEDSSFLAIVIPKDDDFPEGI